jgi:hypothetical protein
VSASSGTRKVEFFVSPVADESVSSPSITTPTDSQPRSFDAITATTTTTTTTPPPSHESSDEASDVMPQLVESSDEESSETDKETDESDDEMPELVSDDEDIVHMLIRDTNCLRCRTAIQTLLSHDHDYLNGVEEDNTLQRKNEFPSIITYILWLFIALHALNLVSTYCGHPSC